MQRFLRVFFYLYFTINILYNTYFFFEKAVVAKFHNFAIKLNMDDGFIR